MYRKGDRIEILPEFRDPGDENFSWIVVGDEEKGRVDISPEMELALRPTYVVPSSQIRYAPPEVKPNASNLTFGYPREALSEAFDKVKNSEHWKGEISATIDEDDFGVTNSAVIFFTGSSLEVLEKLPNGRLRVWAAGYWSAIGS